MLKLIAWLLLLFGLIGFVTEIAIPSDPMTRVLVKAWAFSIIGLPLYWLVKAIWKEHRGK